MTNNDIFKKLRVALHLKDDDILNILKLVDFTISKNELTAVFRKEDHPNYQECGDQLLRNFLNGLIIHMRGPMPEKRNEENTESAKNPMVKTKAEGKPTVKKAENKFRPKS